MPRARPTKSAHIGARRLDENMEDVPEQVYGPLVKLGGPARFGAVVLALYTGVIELSRPIIIGGTADDEVTGTSASILSTHVQLDAPRDMSPGFTHKVDADLPDYWNWPEQLPQGTTLCEAHHGHTRMVSTKPNPCVVDSITLTDVLTPPWACLSRLTIR